MSQIFTQLPKAFFNLLASGANSDIYSDCLLVIYDQYEHQVDYRLPVEQIRNALVNYLSINNVVMQDSTDVPSYRTYNDMANRILYKMCDPDNGWLKRETDDYTLRDNICMTKAGIGLAQYLKSVISNDDMNYAGCIYDIYNTLQNDNQWTERPYDDGLKLVYSKAKRLSSALQQLSTNLEIITLRAIAENSLENVVENFFHFNDTFLPQYSQLKKSANIYKVQKEIVSALEKRTDTEEKLSFIILNCLHSEGWESEEDSQMATVRVTGMIDSIKRFMSEDYDDIMHHISRQMNKYWEIMISQLRYKRSGNGDAQNIIEQVLSVLTSDEQFTSAPDDAVLSDDVNRLFQLKSNRYIDLDSVYQPRTVRVVTDTVLAEADEPTQDHIEQSVAMIRTAADNPFSKSKVKSITDHVLSGKKRITSDDIPIRTKGDALTELSIALYAQENGYDVEVDNSYIERDNIRLRRSKIQRRSNNVTHPTDK